MKLLIASIVLGMAVTAAPAGTATADVNYAAAHVQMADAGESFESSAGLAAAFLKNLMRVH